MGKSIIKNKKISINWKVKKRKYDYNSDDEVSEIKYKYPKDTKYKKRMELVLIICLNKRFI